MQIEGKDEEYWMDEEQRIYDMEWNQIGKAGDSDEEGAEEWSWTLIWLPNLFKFKLWS